MRRLLKISCISVFVLLSVQAKALTVPSYFSNGRTGLVAQTLGASCYSFDLNADSVPCNPAYMAKERPREFKAHLFAGNNVSYLNEAEDLARGRASEETVRSLFSDRSSSELQASLGAAYLAENFSFAIDPFTVDYYSQFRNPPLPEISLFASYENSARMQLASYVGGDFFAGLQLRYLQRQIVASRFFLTDALAEGRDQYLKPQDQKYLFLEPGFLISPEENGAWHEEYSLNLVNFGLRQGDSTLADPTPEFHLGAALSTDFGLGRWGAALDANWNHSIERAEQVFTLGSYYEMGILRLFGSVASDSRGAGFSVRFQELNLGMSYLSKSERIDSSETISSHRLYFLLGATI